MKIDKFINEILLALLVVVLVACTPTDIEPDTNIDATPAAELPDDGGELPLDGGDEGGAATSGIRPNDDLLANPLMGTDWDLVALNDATPTGDITLTFDEEQVGGSDGCNGYGATYTVDGDAIQFNTDGFMSTMMACEPAEIMEEGRAYLDALATAQSFTLDAGTLTITTEQGTLEFAVPENAALEGNRWQLSSIYEADGITSKMLDENIFFTIENGEATGSTGCNELRGSITLGGDELAFDGTAVTERACLDEDVMAREQQFIRVLNQTVRYGINRETLTLEDGDGNPLATFVLRNEEDGMDSTIELDGTSWQLVSIGTAEMAMNGIGSDITAEFVDGGLAGSAGCNRYTTSYTVDGNQLTLAPVATTRRMCDEITGVDENAFLTALREVTQFTATAETLVLESADGLTTLTFEPMEQAASEEKTLFVGAEQVDCTGVGPQKCLLVKESADAEYTFFYDSIDGFEWEAGYEYELIVRVSEVENPPADASSLSYELVELVSKMAVESN